MAETGFCLVSWKISAQNQGISMRGLGYYISQAHNFS